MTKHMHILQPFADTKAILQVVMPSMWVPRINQLAMERGINRSALIREAIEQVYFREQTAETDQLSQLPCIDMQQAEKEGSR